MTTIIIVSIYSRASTGRFLLPVKAAWKKTQIFPICPILSIRAVY